MLGIWLSSLLDFVWTVLAVCSLILLLFDKERDFAQEEVHISSIVCTAMFFMLTDWTGQNRIVAHIVSALALSAAVKQAIDKNPPAGESR